ncbi:MAG TPA: DUF3443 family protein [Steroidobacteraceae bacterium]|jgi:hypothetical protein|nr:DUF3443 family protein [Steroidobacteraceae bacterium]
MKHAYRWTAPLALSVLSACGGGSSHPGSTAPKAYTIGGSITGLTAAGLVLLDNGGDTTTVAANATSYTFPTALGTGIGYAVTIHTQPTGETCTITNGSGTVGSANVTNADVSCTASPTYTIGGSVSGLTASGLVLADGSDTASVAANATSYKLSTGLPSGTTYDVVVSAQPTGETCTVANATDTVGSANVTNANVSCTANTPPPVTYTIGGTIEGLTAAGLVLQDNGGDNYGATAGTAFSFTFATAVAGGGAYAVTVKTQPTGETCIVSDGSGSVASANVTSVIVSCSQYAANLGSNVVAVTVGNGPAAATSPVFNIPYVTVKVCEPSSPTTCAIINNVEVDTGSVGLRLLASALTAPDGGSPVSLTTINDPGTHANTIGECWRFGGGSGAWGPVATANVSLGSETASGVEVQVINDVMDGAPTGGCGTVQFGNVSDFDANGVLGVGVMQQDCGTGCTTVSAGDYYYTCTSSSPSSCTQVGMPVVNQVPNPVMGFAQDNNGIILQLPAIPDAGLPTANGYLVFGIGTAGGGNALTATTVLTADPNYTTFTTLYNGATLTAGNGTGGIIDSGSNALFFPNDNGPTTNVIDTSCIPGGAFYCPEPPISLTAQNENYDGSGTPSTVNFTIDSIADLSSDNYALDDVGGPTTGSFDWGLPFFYGRAVFVAIDGKSAGGTTGPYYAY